MTSEQLAAKVRDEQFLVQAGYEKIRCHICDGQGFQRMLDCYRCDGQGYTWKAPITKVVQAGIWFL